MAKKWEEGKDLHRPRRGMGVPTRKLGRAMWPLDVATWTCASEMRYEYVRYLRASASTTAAMERSYSVDPHVV